MIPISVRGSPNRFGDSCDSHPHFGLGIPVLVWGSPNQNGDPQTEMGMRITRIPKPIRGSPNRNGDQYIPIPKRGSQNRFGDCSVTNQKRFGARSKLGLYGFVPKLERHSKWGPHIRMGIPKSVWVGIYQYSKAESPRSGMGFIPIWGLTYTPRIMGNSYAEYPPPH